MDNRREVAADIKRDHAVKEHDKARRELRRNKYRNQPCPCGSGRKFKDCCRSKTLTNPTD